MTRLKGEKGGSGWQREHHERRHGAMKTASLKRNNLLLEHKVQGKGVVRQETRREKTANLSADTRNVVTE